MTSTAHGHDPRKEQLSRWNEIAESLGYRQGFKSVCYSSADSAYGNVLDHGRVVTHSSGQRVLMGDPYPEACDPEAFADKYGMELQKGEGLWCPGHSALLLFRVVDPLKACPVFRLGYRGSHVVVYYTQPALFMPPGTDMRALRRAANRICVCGADHHE